MPDSAPASPPTTEGPRISVVLPMRDEAPNVVPVYRGLVERLAQRLGDPIGDVEFLFVDDGSQDGSGDLVADLSRTDPRVRLLRLASQRGQSSAVWAGFLASRGELVATMDADQQQDPADLLGMLARLDQSPLIDAVVGVRRVRHDKALRRWSSRVGNTLRRRVTRDPLQDAGCSLKLLRREALSALVPFDGMHRFIGTLLLQRGLRVVEEPVTHAPRRLGTAKYGLWNRVLRTAVDLAGVRWLEKRALENRWQEEAVRRLDAPRVSTSGSLRTPIK
ncbi:MAG: glycosyltransferase family 2 protein [Planctomycetota bacterium]